MDKEKKIVTIKDDVLIGKAGSKDLLGDLFLPPENDPKKPAIPVIKIFMLNMGHSSLG